MNDKAVLSDRDIAEQNDGPSKLYVMIYGSEGSRCIEHLKNSPEITEVSPPCPFPNRIGKNPYIGTITFPRKLQDEVISELKFDLIGDEDGYIPKLDFCTVRKTKPDIHNHTYEFSFFQSWSGII